MKTRPYVLGKDFPEICEWWRARKWQAPPCDSMPQAGVVAESDDGVKLAAVFYYNCEGPWVWLDYVVTNPDAPLRARSAAIELVIASALDEVRKGKRAFGFEPRAITCTGNENLVRIFEKHGFVKGDSLMTTLVWNGGLP
jgi:hypothetical protein